MDLIAYSIGTQDPMSDYIAKYYGEVPRFRGARLMKYEEPIVEEDEKPGIDVSDLFPLDDEEVVDHTEENEMFNKYVGQDVIYIHTRCGNCGDPTYTDKDSNYKSFKADKWEKKHKDLFLDHVTDGFDPTYCTHYFKAVPGEDYDALCKWWLEDE